MASEDGSEKECFTFIWKLENASYCWQRERECIESPLFTVDEIHETNWKLHLFPSIERNNNIGLWLQRYVDKKGLESVKIDYNIAFLSLHSEVLHAFEGKNVQIGTNGYVGTSTFAPRSEIFLEKKSVFIPLDTLTVRCRIWNNVGGMSKDVHCFARTRILVEKRSFLWNIENFSNLQRKGKKSYEIKSLYNGKSFMSLELFLTGGLVYDETIRLKIIPNYQTIKMSTLQLSILDASKNTVKCFEDDFWYRDSCGSKDFTLIYTKSELLEKETIFLPDDILSLSCKCAFSLGTVHEEIEKIDSDYIGLAKMNSHNHSASIKNEFSDSKSILLDNLKSVLNNCCLSDVKLKTKSQVYPAHKFILGVRSPVFKAMFSNDMREKVGEFVDIVDLSDDTLLRMLQYIYSAEVEELDWTSATELYEAADKYEILDLKDICSSYLKSNLGVKNACEALILSDLHQDECLKGFVQDFILIHGKDVISSDEWNQLMETNLKLAAETMRRKFKE